MYASFKEMPPVLKFLTGMAIFFIFLFLKATVPGMFGTFTYNGEVLEFNEIWKRGFGVPLIIIGLLVPLWRIDSFKTKILSTFLLLRLSYRSFYASGRRKRFLRISIFLNCSCCRCGLSFFIQ